ncbi:MAG: bifunctional 4'-phosphopantothenoylcysteine decarboxylase/phosphopantothenoylcysteine synthetase [Gammaproteobacteria bacterium TMED222]|jgi:phosphopantothenoylcysteine decarboxylase/phosphopantothenate--cysteine ligase|nr:MAG: bifunctional 4'-phosphopantothenoylcysteine decarboxylase/phosphopantothenoylcysteine synthetase [Gammaproteobacteria bacterium TMED222]|tara:strand:+ start:57 stop:1253 length:1197 start_codon:yes stop_codon:yes gene_type:complete
MKQLANKHVLLCVTGGIAAYKAAEIIRLFKTSGSNVRVLMTSAAKEFITPLTMQALSGNQVHTDLLDTDAEAAMGHIELAKWSDIVLIAPCSANSIARLASGKGDDLMTAVCLAAECKIYFAPAMNQAMWSDSRTQNNHKKLLENKFIPIGPNSGEQACGDEGYGRMSEPQEIVNNIASGFSEGLLAGKKILITAGPTREKIDPVRFISNRSSGKMGFSIAEAARDEGGLVSLISGPVSLETPNEIKRINVESADEMLSEVDKVINDFDLFISTAAVSDYKPEEYEVQKIKKEKNTDNLNLELITNKDILKHVSKDKGDLKVIGFAAETQNIIENAKRKLNEKNLDLIIANDVSDPSIGFDSDENEVYLITDEIEKKIDRVSKKKLSRSIIEFIANYL